MMQRIVVDTIVNQRIATCHFLRTMRSRNTATEPFETAIPCMKLVSVLRRALGLTCHDADSLSNCLPHYRLGQVEVQTKDLRSLLSNAMGDPDRYTDHVADECRLDTSQKQCREKDEEALWRELLKGKVKIDLPCSRSSTHRPIRGCE